MKKNVIILFSMLIFLITSCTFDYGSTASERETPDLVMENVEYVRVRSSDPIAKFQAERAERYEKQGVMKLHNFSFEQYGESIEEINTSGRAGFASVIIETGDVSMDNGVKLEIESEDIILETKQLEWKDESRILTSGPGDEVNIYQTSGTNFTGIGLRVEARDRLWEFTGDVLGIFIPEDEEDEQTETDTERTVQVPAEIPAVIEKPKPEVIEEKSHYEELDEADELPK